MNDDKDRKVYDKVTNLPVQVDLNVAFDHLAMRVLTERPTAKIALTVGSVTASYNPNATGRPNDPHYSFSF